MAVRVDQLKRAYDFGLQLIREKPADVIRE
jgi:hypothetical protein